MLLILLCCLMIPMFVYVALILLGIVVGTIAAFLGIGGGVLVVPILIFIFGFDIKIAVGTSLLAVLITSLSSASAYIRKKKVIFRLGLLLELASVPGAILGARFTMMVPGYVLKLIFGCFLIVMSVELIRNKKPIQDNHEIDNYQLRAIDKRRLAYAMVLSFLAGFLSASLGIGGGVLKVPIMVTALDLPIHYAIGTSTFMITITVSSGLIQHYFYGHINFVYGTLLGLGALLGAQFGARVSLRTKPKKLRVIFAFLLVLIAVRMLFS